MLCGPFCLPAKQPTTPLCLQVSRPGIDSNRCLSTTVEPVDSLHSPSDSTTPKNTSKGPTGQCDSLGDSPNVARAALVSNSSGVAGRLSSQVANSGRDNHTSLRSSSDTSAMENPPSGCMASVRSRLEATGFSPEVCKILLASWRTSTQKRYRALAVLD